MKKCCGTCKWHSFENISDYCADWTEYDNSCEEWEEKDGE